MPLDTTYLQQYIQYVFRISQLMIYKFLSNKHISMFR